ncbi:unnamed protein product [Ectocarpus sp. 4 AP-2014]
MLLEPQPGSQEASSVCDQITELAIGREEDDNNVTSFTVLTKESLAEMAKLNGISGKRALAQALVWRMAKDREEGLASKKNKFVQDNEKNIDLRDADSELINGGDRGLEMQQNIEGGLDKIEHEIATEGTVCSDYKDRAEDEGEEDLADIARKQAEREKAKLELRAARLFTTVHDDLGAPDRQAEVYILKGFPVTETDAAQFLEENNAFYSSPHKKHKGTGPPPPTEKRDDKPAFLSALDAVIQITTRELVKPAESSPRANSARGSRPGTASSCGSSRSAQDDQANSPGGRGKEADEAIDRQKRESVWDRLRTTDTSRLFTQASGATKALAVAQTKGGTVWQDLSFCYINIVAPPDPRMKEAFVRPSSPDRKPEKKGGAKPIGEIKDILKLAGEFNEMVTQMAFEKFDFHQWFSTAEVVTIPRKDGGIDIARAVSEAKQTGTGPLASSSGASGSAARVKGSLWSTDPALLAYSDLMLAVPDDLSSVATAVYCMVEAVMLECTGATPRPLDTSPPTPLSPHARRKNNAPASVVVGSNYKAPTPVAPPSNERLGSGPEATLKERVPEIGDDVQTQGTDVSTLASTDSSIPHLSRNVVLEFGDLIGERVARAALNRAAVFGEERVDPRAVVAVERAAVAKLQNPRVVGQGALPREPERSEKDRGTEQGELLAFTDLSRKDVDRTRKVWALARLVNTHHPPPGQGELWNFNNRRYWDVLPQHVVQQVLRAENGTEPLCLRQYYPLNFRPSFKDWANMVAAKDSSYTPRTLVALGALMDISKADLDRAKTRSIKLFPADHSLVVMSGFVATSQRWLSVFKDQHVMGLRLTDKSDNTSPRGRTGESHGVDTKGTNANRQLQFAAEFTMSFSDDSRIVVKEGQPPPPPPPSRPASSKGETRKSTTTQGSVPAVGLSTRGLNGGKGKPDGFGTVACVHTFPTGLVVSTGSGGTVGMKFVLDSKRSPGGKFLSGFVPEAAKGEFARAVVGKGTVVRYMRDGSIQMLFVTGDVVVRNGEETILTDKFGKRFRKTQTPVSLAAAGNVNNPTPPARGKASRATPPPNVLQASCTEWVPIPPSTHKQSSGQPSIANKDTHDDRTAPTASDFSASKMPNDGTPVTDVETGATVWCPPGGNERVIVEYEDGLTVTRHADGTTQRWRQGKEDGGAAAAGLVLVECPGFASVEVDVEIEEMCSKHAKRKPVTITRGGNRVRLRAVMPNGGVTLVSYDTRVTSQVCGRVVYVHSDNTEVIANDKGEVVVRPRGMWEGEPVYGKLAGPNSSMPPNCEQPDLLVGTYTFDCLKGVMESEDTDRNRFVLDVTKTTFLREDFSISSEGGSTADGATSPTSPKEKAEKSKRTPSRPSSGKSNGVTIDLAGETAGMRSEALVNEPLEPRLFIYCRDGSALELLRNDDARTWCERLAPISLSQSQQQQPRLGVNKDNHDDRRRYLDRLARAVDVREQDCCPDPHSNGARQLSFYVPVLPTPRGEGSFAALLQHWPGRVFGDDYDHTENVGSKSSWRTRPLPLAARARLGAQVGIPARGCSTAMEACIRRVWLEFPPLSTTAAKGLRQSLAEWEAWKQSRMEQIDRFLVSDPRPTEEVEAQRSVQKMIRKAFREAKAAKQKAKEKARAARAQAAKEQAVARKKAGLSSSRGATAGTVSTVSVEEPSTVASTFGEVGLLDSEEHEDGDMDELDFPDSDEEEEDEQTALLREEAASAFASAKGATEGYLDIPALRRAMVMVLGRAVGEEEAESRLNALRERTFPRQPLASQEDLVYVLLGACAQPSEGAPASLDGTCSSISTALSPGYVSASSPDKTANRRGSAEEKLHHLAPPVFSSHADPPSKATRTTSLRPPPTPTSFWETPVGLSLDDSPPMGCAEKVLGGPAETGAAKSEVEDCHPLGPGNNDGNADRNDLDRVSVGAPGTLTGEGSHRKDDTRPSPGGSHTGTGDSLEETQSHVEGGDVAGENAPAQGTGTMAVRSLSKGGGGLSRGNEEAVE